MKMAARLAPALVVLLVAAAAAAHDVTPPSPTEMGKAAPTATVEKKDEKVPESVAMLTGAADQNARKFPLGGLVLLEQELGTGTLVQDKYARNPFYAWWISIRPRYYVTNKFFLELRQDFNWELTNSFGTATTYKRQFMPGDLSLTARYDNAYRIPKAEIGISPYFRIFAPTSYESRYRSLQTTLSLGADISRSFLNKIFLTYTIRASKNFNKYTTATVTGPVAVTRARGNEDLGNGVVATGDNNVEWGLTNILMGTWSINDQFSLTLMLGIINSWTYKTAGKDALAADSSKGGRGQRDKTLGVVDLSYQPWDHYGFSVGLYSYQPAKTDNNKSFRFPFFDFRSEANNYTYGYLDVYATY